MEKPSATAKSVVEEFEGARVGDERRSKRLIRIVERLSSAPSASFPQLFPDNGELEAAYDFFANERIRWQEILAPHVRATIGRCVQSTRILILHDTTDFIFAGNRLGLGTVMSKTKGFFCHTSLALADDELHTPLGVLALGPYVRTRERGSKSKNEWKREQLARPTTADSGSTTSPR